MTRRLTQVLDGLANRDFRYAIFISSTYNGFEKFRKATRDAILRADCFPVEMEDFVPVGNSTVLQTIAAYMQPCDAMILISGPNEGSLAFDNLTYVEWELQQAEDRGIPVLCFEKAGRQVEAGQQRLLERLQTRKQSITQYRNLGDFSGKVANAVERFRTSALPPLGFVPLLKLDYPIYRNLAHQEFLSTVSCFLAMYLSFSRAISVDCPTT